MEKEFVPYELALRLKELGFDEPCFAFYRGGKDFYIKGQHKNTTLAPTIGPTVPTFSQAFRWFREKYDMIAEFNWHFPSKCYATSIYPNDFYLQAKTYEEAELACLDKLLEIVESKQKEDGK